MCRVNSDAALLAIACVLTVFLLAGCNTTAGLGEDLEAAGEAIEGEAQEAKSY